MKTMPKRVIIFLLITQIRFSFIVPHSIHKVLLCSEAKENWSTKYMRRILNHIDMVGKQNYFNI